MRNVVAYTLCAALAATPALSQEQENLREGMDLLSEGTKLLLKGLIEEIEPALRELEGALQDLNAYHPPEVLPNGDIIIRRKEPRPITPPLAEDGEIEL